MVTEKLPNSDVSIPTSCNSKLLARASSSLVEHSGDNDLHVVLKVVICVGGVQIWCLIVVITVQLHRYLMLHQTHPSPSK